MEIAHRGALGSVHEFRSVLFERELIYAWDGERTSPSNDQRSCLGGAQSSVSKHSRAGAPAELSDRDFLEAVLYLNRVGCPWRDLPPELGYWHAVYMRFRRWEERGVWRRLWQCLQCECLAQARHLLTDSTTVLALQHAAGAPKKTAATRLWGALVEDCFLLMMRRPS